jgi:hypothetical protein
VGLLPGWTDLHPAVKLPSPSVGQMGQTNIGWTHNWRRHFPAVRFRKDKSDQTCLRPAGSADIMLPEEASGGVGKLNACAAAINSGYLSANQASAVHLREPSASLMIRQQSTHNPIDRFLILDAGCTMDGLLMLEYVELCGQRYVVICPGPGVHTFGLPN